MIGRERIGEAGVIEIADAQDIGHVEDVESFAEQIDRVMFAEPEGAVQPEIERIEAVIEPGVRADLRKHNVTICAGLEHAPGCVSVRNESIELLSVVKFASTGVALQSGNSFAAIGKKDVHGYAGRDGPDGREVE